MKRLPITIRRQRRKMGRQTVTYVKPNSEIVPTPRSTTSTQCSPVSPVMYSRGVPGSRSVNVATGQLRPYPGVHEYLHNGEKTY
ncbi:hypothetical protein J6590_039516 [Homalodisca vitripennis]|nr:hypothetical protein J6590_039516 [Homalodisca vitripennis]